LKACRERGFPALAVAHNEEDRIETFWMRLVHGSGLDGLAGMAAARNTDGIQVIRPVLGFSRGRLRATCKHYGAAWIEDPSNENKKYLRVKLRAFENLLAEQGLTPERLSLTLQKLEDARDALQTLSEWAAFTCLKFHPGGYASLEADGWKVLPRDVQRRILGFALSTVAPLSWPAGFEALEQTRIELLKPDFAGKTLAGCEIFPDKSGSFYLSREASAVENRVPVQEGTVWDKRFILSGFGENLNVGALEEAGLSVLRKNEAAAAALESFPYKIKRVLPALWQGENIAAVPHIGYYAEDKLKSGKITFRVKIV
jgi:tRNA(Ile)-lysidine synthase